MSDEIIKLSDLFKEEEPKPEIKVIADPNIKHSGFELRHYSYPDLLYPGLGIKVDCE